MPVFKNRPIQFYVIAVVIVFAVVLALRYLILGSSRVLGVAVFCAGFILSMFGMYIAANLYRSKFIWENQNRLNEPKK